MMNNIKIGKTFKYIENRDENGRLIGITEMKSTIDPSEIAKLKDEIRLNSEIIKKEKLAKEAVKLKELEKSKYIKKYNIQNLFIASIYPIILNKINIDDINKLIGDINKITDVYDKAKMIEKSLTLEKFSLLNDYFNLF